MQNEKKKKKRGKRGRIGSTEEAIQRKRMTKRNNNLSKGGIIEWIGVKRERGRRGVVYFYKEVSHMCASR